MIRKLIVLGAALCLRSELGAQEAKKDGKVKYDFKPQMLEAKEGGGTSLGVEYKIEWEQALKTFGGDENSPAINASAVVTQLAYSLIAKGLATAVAERNPRNFLEFSADAKVLWSGGPGTFTVGPKISYETDQAFEDEAVVISGVAAWGKFGWLGRNSFIGLTGSFGQVDPKGDSARADALGTQNLESYNRWTFEGLYMLPISVGPVVALEVSGRLFMESTAPAAIEIAELDEHRLVGVRLGLKNDLFVAWSNGRLPYDRRKDKVLAIGWSYKVQ